MTRFSTFLAASLCGLALAACGRGEQGAGDTAGATAAPTISGTTTGMQPAAGDTTAGATAQLLDPDAATREQLLTIPGIDAALADSLVAGRPYADMRAVDRVLAVRLSEPQRDSVYVRLFKPLDLNTATKEEIELIPGVGARMRHEFEEYRPYRSLAQFRREIGKYVDSAEVARLERYVTIR